MLRNITYFLLAACVVVSFLPKDVEAVIRFGPKQYGWSLGSGNGSGCKGGFAKRGWSNKCGGGKALSLIHI